MIFDCNCGQISNLVVRLVLEDQLGNYIALKVVSLKRSHSSIRQMIPMVVSYFFPNLVFSHRGIRFNTNMIPSVIYSLNKKSSVEPERPPSYSARCWPTNLNTTWSRSTRFHSEKWCFEKGYFSNSRKWVYHFLSNDTYPLEAVAPPTWLISGRPGRINGRWWCGPSPTRLKLPDPVRMASSTVRKRLSILSNVVQLKHSNQQYYHVVRICCCCFFQARFFGVN